MIYLKKIIKMQDYIKILDKSEFQLEILIDWKIFDEDVILKTAYEYMDKIHFYFTSEWKNYKVHLRAKDTKSDIMELTRDFNDDLVHHRLRKSIDQQTWKLRQKIVETALWYWLTLNEIKWDIQKLSMMQQEFEQEGSQEDNAKDRNIDDIINDIQNDPEFSEDKDEIISILKEINS